VSEEERNYTEEAVAQGWNENYDGANKVDAKEFVEKGEKIAGILKSKNERLETRLASLEQSNKQFGEYHKKTLETQRKQDAEKISVLEDKLDQAVTDGDGQAHREARREIEAIKDVAPVQADDAQQWNQMAEAWAGNNKWYKDNPKLAAYADGRSDQLRSQGYVGQAYFAELTRDVEETFPEEFSNPNKSKAGATETSGQQSTDNSKDESYDNLPAEAKAACDDFVSQGFMKREDYVKQYDFGGT